MGKEYSIVIDESTCNYDDIILCSQIDVISQKIYQGSRCAYISFNNDSVAFLQKKLNFESISSYLLVAKDGHIFSLTKDTFLNTNIKKRKHLILSQFNRLLWSEKRTEKIRAKDFNKYGTLTSNTIVSDSFSLLFPSFRRCKFYRIKDKFCHRFRLHTPHSNKEKYPLLIFLDGAGSHGYDNNKQMFGLINPWHRLKKSRNDCYIVAPQLGWLEAYNRDEHSETLWELVELLSNKYGNIDKSRLYLVGISYGGYGVIYEAFRHPERYAAAVAAVGWVYDKEPIQINYDLYKKDKYHMPIDDEGINVIAKTSMWLACSIYEIRWNQPLFERLNAVGADVKYTRNDKHGHQMSRAFFRKQPWDIWMFEKTKD